MEKGKDKNKTTPMMRQYYDVKAQFAGYILFYRLGDFYEMFAEDAVTVSRELELTLTARAGVPMCGVPYHAADNYAKRLIDKGYKIAVCDQIGTSAGNSGLFERSVTKIITAGTVIEDSMLDGKNNFIGSFFAEPRDGGKNPDCACCFADVSTGEVYVPENGGLPAVENELIAEIARYNPSEFLFNDTCMEYKNVTAFIKNNLIGCTGELLPEENFRDTEHLRSLPFYSEIENLPWNTFCALAALFAYLRKTRAASVGRFVGINRVGANEYMKISYSAGRNLELTKTLRGD